MAQELLDWASTHPGEPLPAFLRDHPSVTMDEWSWGDSAVKTLLEWSSRNPDAARELAGNPDLPQWSAANRAC